MKKFVCDRVSFSPEPTICSSLHFPDAWIIHVYHWDALLYFLFVHACVYICVCTHKCTVVCMWNTEDNPWELVLSFHHGICWWNSGHQGLHGKYFYKTSSFPAWHFTFVYVCNSKWPETVDFKHSLLFIIWKMQLRTVISVWLNWWINILKQSDFKWFCSCFLPFSWNKQSSQWLLIFPSLMQMLKEKKEKSLKTTWMFLMTAAPALLAP